MMSRQEKGEAAVEFCKTGVCQISFHSLPWLGQSNVMAGTDRLLSLKVIPYVQC